MLDQLDDAMVVMARAKLADTVAELAPAKSRTWRESDFDWWDFCGLGCRRGRADEALVDYRFESGTEQLGFHRKWDELIDAIHRLRKTQRITFSYPDYVKKLFHPTDLSNKNSRLPRATMSALETTCIVRGHLKRRGRCVTPQPSRPDCSAVQWRPTSGCQTTLHQPRDGNRKPLTLFSACHLCIDMWFVVCLLA